MYNAKIIATGSYLPSKILTNQQLEQMVDTSDEWIFSRSGIRERRIIDNNETTADMAYNAAINALSNAKIDKSLIDLIIVATSSPDMVFPSNSCLVHKLLELNNNAGAFDLQAACSGFIYAINTADAYIKSGKAKTILVIGVDAVSRFVDYTDRNTCVLFGDGAGAVILQATTDEGIIASNIHADGSGEYALNIPSYIKNGNIIGNPYIYMDGKAVFKMAVNNLAQVSINTISQTKYNNSDIDWLIPHQANIRIIQATAEHLKIPMEKVITTVDKHGNTSAASIPLALDYGISSGKIKKGQLLLLEGVGAGFTWGAALIRF